MDAEASTTVSVKLEAIPFFLFWDLIGTNLLCPMCERHQDAL